MSPASEHCPGESERGPAWPPIDDEVEAAVRRQLHETVSIYDRSGIIARFENAFAARHRTHHPLLTSSGTAALHSAYYGLGLGPGDEVLVQDYTFFATAMPLFQLGALPVLVDVDTQGRLDLDAAASQVTQATRAVVVTHMWGTPQDLTAVRAFADRHDLALVEDCSHAHGASRAGIGVGQLADAAVWSLQGKKTVTAGEGGILTTPHRRLHDRAVLLGHFNKRALAEVDPTEPLRSYAETGTGLKYRAHPLGLAMAEVYLSRLDDWLAHRRRHALALENLLAGRLGIRLLTPASGDHVSTFYAFVVGIDEDEAGYDADRLLTAVHRHGFPLLETTGAMRPLHTYPAFRRPRSPVTRYRAPAIRSDLFRAGTLAGTTLRVDLPVNDGPAARRYVERLARALTGALDDVGGKVLNS